MNLIDPTIAGRVRELLRPGFYGPNVRRVRLIQTHTSWVFLTGEYCYKVKKPVNFGFLDYTTLSARRFFCTEEFRLNKQLSADIYLAVLPITLGRRGVVLGGRGRVIDYCIKMCELPQSAIMTEQLKHGRVTFAHIDSVARQIALFHERAERGPQVAQYGSSEIVRLNWDENFAQTLDFRGRTITYPQFDFIRRAVEQFIQKKRHLFRHRREAGFVRKCHGDLHSKNIFIIGPDIRIFDCIEFNPRFSCSDVASEVAFMVMDLDYHDRHDLANFFVERYVEYARDPGLLRLLDFYLCYRAYVRGKVTSFNLNDPGMTAQDKVEAKTSARRYFHLSERYARKLFARNWLCAMVGLPGTGKTYIARRLASRTLAFHLLSDSIRKQLVGIPVGTHVRPGADRGIYRQDISRRTYAELLRRARVLLAAGHSVILDATFLREDSRQEVRDLARRAGVKVLFVFADCPEKTVVSRMRRRLHAQCLSDADIGIYRRMKARFVPPKPGHNLIRIDTRQPVNRSLEKIERVLLHR
ncbi:MAG: AAA family ATPase [candidate division WOR-3 bacterium]